MMLEKSKVEGLDDESSYDRGSPHFRLSVGPAGWAPSPLILRFQEQRGAGQHLEAGLGGNSAPIPRTTALAFAK
ncbi:hypothetical protein N7492_008144 [Penicillium capsulatum]|uniref:Uncharacterized protein n=1 Tax=Penicillium capsulatum TaxID=69766 RepID=A0A9W9HQ73_9EURO|nr:hypothetical protein N7492_008144 [Penicillium capsulatum]KAJ6105555.1 hypothetical protein N7512_009072 [Penicillium capsulatum]